MSLFGGPPNIDKMRRKRDVAGLIKAVAYEKDAQVRREAAIALGDLDSKVGIAALVERLVVDEDSGVKRSAADALDKLQWSPGRDKASAVYWSLRGDVQQCGTCGLHAIGPLLPFVMNRNQEAMQAFVSLGLPALETLIASVNGVLQQYQSIASSTRSLNFMSADDKRKAALIDRIAEVLGNLAEAIGLFGDPLSEAYLVRLYTEVRTSVYSDPTGGFGDMFKAVDVRQNIVRAIRHTSGAAGLNLLADVMETDRAQFVRWEAADVVENHANESMARVRNSRIVDALAKLVADMQQEERQGKPGISGCSRLPRYVGLLDRLRS